jgi:hypothetical protein
MVLATLPKNFFTYATLPKGHQQHMKNGVVPFDFIEKRLNTI